MADHFVLGELVRGLRAHEHDFAEFFRAPSGTLSLTIARWPAGATDDQRPHSEDEVYYVVSGTAVLTVAGERVAIAPGSVAYVAAGAEHRFVEIEDDLETLVFWSPARHTDAR